MCMCVCIYIYMSEYVALRPHCFAHILISQAYCCICFSGHAELRGCWLDGWGDCLADQLAASLAGW